MSTCINVGDNICGVEPFETIDAVYVGFPNCNNANTFCEVNPCFVSRAESVDPSADRSEMWMAVSTNGRILVVREPSLDLIRVYDRTDSEWHQRGETIEGTRNTNFGRRVALATPHASLITRQTGLIPIVLAISSARTGLAKVNVMRWSYNDRTWSNVGFEVDPCARAQLDTCTLKSLDVVYSHEEVKLVLVLSQNLVMVLGTIFQAREGDKETWETYAILEGSGAALSQNGEYLAILDQTEAIISTFSFEDNLETSISFSDMRQYGSTIHGFRLSHDGSAISVLVSSPSSQGGFLVYHSGFFQNTSKSSQKIQK